VAYIEKVVKMISKTSVKDPDKHGGYFEILSRTELGTRIRIILPQED